jgi:hypothetical protein
MFKALAEFFWISQINTDVGLSVPAVPKKMLSLARTHCTIYQRLGDASTVQLEPNTPNSIIGKLTNDACYFVMFTYNMQFWGHTK